MTKEKIIEIRWHGRGGQGTVTATKISRNKIYDLSPIESPDMIVVLDHLLLEENGVVNGLKPGGVIVINTPKPLHAYRFPGMTVAVADVISIASQTGLKPGIVHSGILG